MSEWDYTSTTSIDIPDVTAKMPKRKSSKLAYYWHVAKWMWAHKDEPNNRAKWRRMMREVVE